MRNEESTETRVDGGGNDISSCVHVSLFTVGFKKANDNAFMRSDTAVWKWGNELREVVDVVI